ncbi:hypothetical protein BH23ACT3_BH23ACT3_06830 [soil metagenome]
MGGVIHGTVGPLWARVIDPPMRELLLPRTDAGVIVQLVLVVLATVVAAVLVRRERALVTLVAGLGVMSVALMGVRALH